MFSAFFLSAKRRIKVACSLATCSVRGVGGAARLVVFLVGLRIVEGRNNMDKSSSILGFAAKFQVSNGIIY